MATTYTCSDGDTVDLVCWRFYGKTADGIVENVLAANQDLADVGATLPAGTQIVLPELEVVNAPKIKTLWELT